MNEAVLVIMLFTMNPYESGLGEYSVQTISVDTMEKCDYLGENLREFYYRANGEHIPEGIYTLSYCVHYTEFAK